MMQRSVLEHAGYCLTIYEKPELERVFLFRHLGPDEMKEQREAFKIGPAKEAVRRFRADAREYLRRELPEVNRLRRPSESTCFVQRCNPRRKRR